MPRKFKVVEFYPKATVRTTIIIELDDLMLKEFEGLTDAELLNIIRESPWDFNVVKKYDDINYGDGVTEETVEI